MRKNVKRVSLPLFILSASLRCDKIQDFRKDSSFNTCRDEGMDARFVFAR